METNNNTDKYNKGDSTYESGGIIDEPKIYVASLSDYNDGNLVGKWIDFADYSDGNEILGAIDEYLEELNKQDGGSREEWAIHDYEGFPESYYSENMGEEEFDKIYKLIEVSEKYSHIPSDVAEEYANDYGNEDVFDAYEEIDSNGYGFYKDKGDWASSLIEEGVYVPSVHDIYVTDTDKRLIASDEADTMVDDLDEVDFIERSDMGEEIQEIESKIEELENEQNDLDTHNNSESLRYDEIEEELDELKSDLEKLKNKAINKGKEQARNEFYDEIYYKLENELKSYLIESGYEMDNLPSFVRIDYDSVADDLASDYALIESSDGNVYVINLYANGGKLPNSKAGKFTTMDKGGAVYEWVTSTINTNVSNRELAEKKLEEAKKDFPEGRNFRIEEVEYDWGIDYRIVFEYERRKLTNDGGVDSKIRFDVDFYDSYSEKNRETSIETIIRANSLEEAIANSLEKAPDLEKNYIEFYHRGFFLGSINLLKSKEFIEGEYYKKFMSNNILYEKGGSTYKRYGIPSDYNEMNNENDISDSVNYSGGGNVFTNENHGIILNKIFNEWNKIKTDDQQKKWEEMVSKQRFGTYNQLDVLDIMDNFNPKFRNEIIKRDFINEVTNALK